MTMAQQQVARMFVVYVQILMETGFAMTMIIVLMIKIPVRQMVMAFVKVT